MAPPGKKRAPSMPTVQETNVTGPKKSVRPRSKSAGAEARTVEKGERYENPTKVPQTHAATKLKGLPCFSVPGRCPCRWGRRAAAGEAPGEARHPGRALVRPLTRAPPGGNVDCAPT